MIRSRQMLLIVGLLVLLIVGLYTTALPRCEVPEAVAGAVTPVAASAPGKVDEYATYCNNHNLVESNALRKIDERQAWLVTRGGHLKNNTIRDWVSATVLQPYYPCSWTLRKTLSVRHVRDGGKWVCGMDELARSRPNSCVAYSIGSNFETSFESTIEKFMPGCNIHIYDPTLHSTEKRAEKFKTWQPQLPANWHFHEAGIVGETLASEKNKKVHGGVGDATFATTLSLREAFEQNGHAESGIEILKFDIEGFEYEVFRTMDWSRVKIGLILFEMHPDKMSRLKEEAKRGKYLLSDLLTDFLKMEEAGYRMYSMEPVCTSCAGRAEIGMMHKDWHPLYGFSRACNSPAPLP